LHRVTGEPAGREYYYPHEGLNKWYACQFVKMDDGLVMTNLDITERRLAEEKSREQAHFIARVNETLPDLMTVTKLPSGQVLYVNRDPHEAPGFERDKVLHIPLEQQTALLRMHPDDAAALPDYFVRAAALADHEIATYSYRARFDTDTWRWFHVRGSVFQRDPTTGAATQILSVAQDVTARKEAELQQAKSYQLLEQSEEVASLGSWEYDRSTGEFL
jgi:PAS domain S-box-containing protein